MKVYKYEPESMEYVGVHNCQNSPLEIGVFLKPQFYTEIKPPEQKENVLIIFNGSKWEEIENYRGCESFDDDGQPKIISELGEVVREKPDIGLVLPKWDGIKFVESETTENKKERLYATLRGKRNKLLYESDKMMLPDFPNNSTQEIIDYRQKLRDMPAEHTTVAKLESPVWPSLS